MAITNPVLVLNEFDVANLGTYLTSAVTLTAGRRYFISIHGQRPTGGTTDVTSVTHDASGTPLAFAIVTDSEFLARVRPTEPRTLEVWEVRVSSTTANAAITIVWSVATLAAGWILWYVTGDASAAAIEQVRLDTGAASPASILMDTFTASDNMAVLSVAVGVPAITINVDESRTEIAKNNETERMNHADHYQNPHGGDTSLTASGFGANVWGAIGIEIAAEVTGASIVQVVNESMDVASSITRQSIPIVGS